MIHPHEAYERLTSAGDDWADTEAAASLLEETRKTLRATLMVGFIRSGSAIGKALEQAQATPEYLDHVKSMCDARRLANKAKVRWISAQTYVDLMRTAEATKRAELKAL